MNLPVQIPFPLMLTKWAGILNPVIANSIINGQQISAKLINGNNVINHLLSRQMQGWFIVDQDAAAQIFRSAQLNNRTLTLTSDAPVNVSIWVY